MTVFTAELAGLIIEIHALFPQSEVFFRDYIAGSGRTGIDTCSESSRKCDFAVTVSEADIEFERRKSAERDIADGISVRSFSDSYLETLAILRHIAGRLPHYDAVLFHGSVIAYNGRAYVFTAPSGTGKTTHARLWLDLLPDACVLNGDKPFLKVTDGSPDDGFSGCRILACGTPWKGKEDLGCNMTLPLEGICLLEQSADNHIEQISFSDALPGLIRQLYIPDNDKLTAIRLLGSIGQSVRLWRLGCNTDPEAAVISTAAMTSASDRTGKGRQNDDF